MRWLTILMLVGMWANPIKSAELHTPATQLVTALADARTVPLQRQPYLRYLSCYQATAAEREGYYQSVSFLLNSLSRERTISRAAIVPTTDTTLIRVMLDDYGIDPKAWDALVRDGSGPAASRSGEPYFSTRLVQTIDTYADRQVPAGRDRYGRPQYRTEQVKSGTTTRTVVAAAPWLPLGETAQLQALTGSQFPIARADWWLAYASWAPAYYDLLGLGKEAKDFERLAFADVGLAERARSQTQGAVTFSTVALHNRALIRTPTVSGYLGGWLWKSLDAAKSVDDQDFINVLLDARFFATEQILSLPNMLQAYFLTDGKGKRLDVAVADVAIDNETILADKQVWAARNCITCHARGMRTINDEVRGLTWGRVALLVTDPVQARRVKDLYFSADLGAVVEHDAQLYEAAVRAANGLSGPENARLFERLVKRHLDEPVTTEVLAAEAGASTERLLAALKTAVGIDHTLVGHLQGRPSRRDQTEKAFAQLMLLLGVK